jgi:hypothetical protein
MKKPIIPQDEYQAWVSDLKDRIRKSQVKAALSINAELLSLYWMLGKDIFEKQMNSAWGASIIDKLAHDLHMEFPELKGFSRSHLFNIRKWYLFYNQDITKVQQLVGLLNTQHRIDALAPPQLVQQAVGLLPNILSSSHKKWLIQKVSLSPKIIKYEKITSFAVIPFLDYKCACPKYHGW